MNANVMFSQLLIGGLRGTVKRLDDGNKNRITFTASLSLAHAHTNTPNGSMHSMIEHAPISPAETECYFWATAHLCS